jgi:predicted nucleic acid-binding protein
MAGRSFVDTNVFVYAIDTAEPAKQQRAQDVLRATPSIVVSTQVMNEFYTTSTRKLPSPLAAAEAAAVVAEMSRYTCVAVDADLVLRAVRAGQRWQLSHWDALILEAARQAGCEVILTEDLANGADYDGVRVENPFREL